jgi:hypothetical protein
MILNQTCPLRLPGLEVPYFEFDFALCRHAWSFAGIQQCCRKLSIRTQHYVAKDEASFGGEGWLSFACSQAPKLGSLFCRSGDQQMFSITTEFKASRRGWQG